MLSLYSFDLSNQTTLKVRLIATYHSFFNLILHFSFFFHLKVHRAKLNDGRDVVIKVQHAEVAERLLQVQRTLFSFFTCPMLFCPAYTKLPSLLLSCPCLLLPSILSDKSSLHSFIYYILFFICDRI